MSGDNDRPPNDGRFRISISRYTRYYQYHDEDDDDDDDVLYNVHNII
jgi:hypothetical protein